MGSNRSRVDTRGLVQAYKVLLTGRVQGVGFRWFTEMEARAREVSGYVRNLPDGRVEVFAQGEESALASFWKCLRRGPGAARVDDLEIEPVPVDSELSSFSVRG